MPTLSFEDMDLTDDQYYDMMVMWKDFESMMELENLQEG